ncbi:MAG: zf-HC2 domain-containing protein [Acidobacteriota bacterium]
MNCHHFEKLIPLYIEGDLDEREMKQVAIHVSECHACARLANQFNASQAWMQTLTPPEFNEAFFRDLQQSVMQEIQASAARQTFLQALGWRWKPVYALAFLLLILFGAFTFYVFSGKSVVKENPEIVNRGKDDETPQQTPPDKPPEPLVMPNDNPNDKPRGTGIAGVRKPRVKPQERIKLPDVWEPQNILEPIVTTEISLQNPDDIFSEEPHWFETDFKPIETTRIEIQTGDPNVRIIWFAPKPTESPKTITD